MIPLQKGHYKQTCRGGISSARLYGGLQHKKKPDIVVEASEFEFLQCNLDIDFFIIQW